MGTWKVKVTKIITTFADEQIGVEEVEICTQEAALPVYDLRGKENYLVSPPDGTTITCDVEVNGQAAEIHVFSSVDLFNQIDPFTSQLEDLKQFGSAAFFISQGAPPTDGIDGRFILMNGRTRDLETGNLILRGADVGGIICSAPSPGEPVEPIDPEDPQSVGKRNQTDPDPCAPGSVVEAFVVHTDLFDPGQ